MDICRELKKEFEGIPFSFEISGRNYQGTIMRKGILLTKKHKVPEISLRKPEVLLIKPEIPVNEHGITLDNFENSELEKLHSVLGIGRPKGKVSNLNQVTAGRFAYNEIDIKSVKGILKFNSIGVSLEGIKKMAQKSSVSIRRADNETAEERVHRLIDLCDFMENSFKIVSSEERFSKQIRDVEIMNEFGINQKDLDRIIELCSINLSESLNKNKVPVRQLFSIRDKELISKVVELERKFKRYKTDFGAKNKSKRRMILDEVSEYVKNEEKSAILKYELVSCQMAEAAVKERVCALGERLDSEVQKCDEMIRNLKLKAQLRGGNFSMEEMSVKRVEQNKSLMKNKLEQVKGLISEAFEEALEGIKEEGHSLQNLRAKLNAIESDFEKFSQGIEEEINKINYINLAKEERRKSGDKFYLRWDAQNRYEKLADKAKKIQN